MDRLISCEFNMDTACVELKFLDVIIIPILLQYFFVKEADS